MISTPFSPKHQLDRQFELCWHPTCTHTTWRVRASPLAPDLSEEQIPAAPKYLPVGSPYCPACRKGQEHPDANTPRLICSIFAKRITAIGFGRARKDGLKALSFQWGRVEGVWVYPADGTNSLEASLARLGKALGCAIELADTRKVPPRPVNGHVDAGTPQTPIPAIQPSPEVGTISDTKLEQPLWAVIACPAPGASFSQNAEQQEISPIFATMDWPPQFQAIQAASCSCPYPGVPQVLVSPSIRYLTETGYSQIDLWGLASRLAEASIALSTPGGDFNLSEHFSAIRRLRTGSDLSITPASQIQKLQKGIAPQSVPDSATTKLAEVPPLEVTRVLTLPAVPVLIQQGFTMTDLFRLAADLTPLGMSLRTADGLIDLSKPMAAARSLPRGSGDPVSPIPSKPRSKGGRPATARALQDQVLQLHQEGHSAIAIARTLHISDRSVRRFLPPKTDF